MHAPQCPHFEFSLVFIMYTHYYTVSVSLESGFRQQITHGIASTKRHVTAGARMHPAGIAIAGGVSNDEDAVTSDKQDVLHPCRGAVPFPGVSPPDTTHQPS